MVGGMEPLFDGYKFKIRVAMKTKKNSNLGYGWQDVFSFHPVNSTTA